MLARGGEAPGSRRSEIARAKFTVVSEKSKTASGAWRTKNVNADWPMPMLADARREQASDALSISTSQNWLPIFQKTNCETIWNRT